MRSLAAVHDESVVAGQLERRRRAAAEAWSLESGQAVVIGAGTPVPVPGRADRTYPFHAHSEYLYLTDRERPGAVLAFDPGDGWSDFVPQPTAQELLWSGAPAAEPGISTEELPGWLEARQGARIANLGSPVGGVESDADLEANVRYALNRIRRVKDDLELERMRQAERATRAGFAVAAELIEPGRSERELQIEIEAAFLRSGGDGLAFETIVAGGPNSAVLHSMPTSRVVADGELVLVDAGAEVRGYASDVTRTYPASGSFTPEQEALHALVGAACAAAIERCAPGTEWLDVHAVAAGVIAEGLVDFGLLRGEPDALVESGAVTLFFPHGIGHMVGLGVRDAGEVLRGRAGTRPGFPRVRVDLPLEPGHCFTVEPGIYFVPALLQDEERRRKHADAVDWDRVDRMLEFGGIRIEHDVLVTDDGHEVLTADVPLLG
jgi:Xaa-Pro aminopeptidase